ncbi:Chromosomal replication initiator protein DnaA [candidate division SR1 bacterium Aalborg_AAW-1]|nr:Chromosomal replication initiator protein DnaA [candidate division SR1 bacterium Aalborg_AAW-1]
MLFETKQTYTPEQITALTTVWSDLIQYLSLHHDHKFILGFLNNCGVVAIDDKHKKIDIGVPNEFILSQVKKFFSKTLKSAVQSTYNQQFSYDLVIFEQFQSKIKNPLHIDMRKLLKISPSVQATISIEKQPNNPSSSFGYTLQHHLTFDTIVTGAHIDFALSAARAVADQPGKVYNPLFIYGHVGLGKTHLLNAIGNSIQKHHNSQNIVFLPTTQLIDHIVMAIRKNKLNTLLSEFKKIDVLLLDDVQFLGDKDKTQEIFLNIFNEMQQAGKQIVLTSDRAPRELNNIEARLKSRFGLGLVCDITEPDFETRLAILQSKVAMKGEHIDSEHLHILAQNITSNVRELEGAINIILTKKSLSGQETTIDTVHDCLRTLGYRIKGEQTVSVEEMNSLNSRSLMNFGTIVEYVAAYYSLSVADLKSEKRSKDISLARQMLMVIAKSKFQRTFEKIGNYFGGKNHAAVIYAVKEFPKKLKADPSLNHDYTLVLEQVER